MIWVREPLHFSELWLPKPDFRKIVFNVTDGQVAQMLATTLKKGESKERADLQRWIEEYPKIMERDLLMIAIK
jgi:hypothetical protein